MSIHFQNDRPAMTLLPDLVDEATGERIEDTAMVTETHLTAFAKEEQEWALDPETEYEEQITYITEEEAQELGVYDELTEEVSAVELSDITTEVLEQSSTYDEAQASAVLEAPMDNSPGDVTVAYLRISSTAVTCLLKKLITKHSIVVFLLKFLLGHTASFNPISIMTIATTSIEASL